ncbi:Oidioi.mRNA.OKI2018_I69.PAR.g13175.t1.cds [Oikopleura dioica]|uniref:Oidioi.mRNA.OKI2018_I69.PAR.g13175.t1.cds n=1 Tax=Oikopleura dioica TaxID=34765 RepID=A0ABN7S571_OIKDI|nr:Oidioi.mRNA.OKI2018_I69.PAR.g13175.t1.cds [Oikopleura dioica]
MTDSIASEVKQAKKKTKVKQFHWSGRFSKKPRPETPVYVPLAERMYKQENSLPDRFKAKPAPVAVKSIASPRNTIPSGPCLATYARKGKTRRELEGERLRNERNAKLHSSANADLQKKTKKGIIKRKK